VSAAAEVRFNGRRDCRRAASFAELSLVVYGLRRKYSISPANLFRFRIADLKSFIAARSSGCGETGRVTPRIKINESLNSPGHL
jgi:hypothetical protein